MRLRLTPRETIFYGMFADASDNLVAAASLLGEMLEAEPVDRAGIAERMHDIEHAGDEITHRILRELSSSFITPFDREDIYRLASTLDDVLDAMDAACDLIVLYEVERLPKELSDLITGLEQAAAQTADAMRRLRSMTDLAPYWIEANRLENEADQAYRRLLAKLFSGKYDTLTVMKLKEVVDALEDAADGFEHVANTVESIALKES